MADSTNETLRAKLQEAPEYIERRVARLDDLPEGAHLMFARHDGRGSWLVGYVQRVLKAKESDHG